MRTTCLTTFAAALMLAQAACTGDKAAESRGARDAYANTPAAAPNLVTVTATDFAFAAPATIPAGLTTVRVLSRGAEFHHVQLVRLDPGHTVDELMEHASTRQHEPMPAWVHFVGGPNAPAPGGQAEATMELQAGTYALLCVIPTDGVPHMMKGMVGQIVVAGSRLGAKAPRAGITISAREYDFRLSRPLRAGTTTIAVFSGGRFVHADGFAVGGTHVTMDLARGLNARVADAERIKTLYGTVLTGGSDARELMSVPAAGDDERDVLATSQRCLDECAKLIRAAPDHWLWTYKRWKRRPSAERAKGLALAAVRATHELEARVHRVAQHIGQRSPRARRAAGLHFVPEERLGRGAVPSLSLAENTLLTRTGAVRPSGWIDTRSVTTLARQLIQSFNVKAGGPGVPASSLSGGNLQKFIVGREIEAGPKLLIVSQPTWGVDVGAAAQIRANLVALRDSGCAVLVVSEELDELFEVADRLHVIAKGRLSPSLDRADATIERIGEWMSGLWDDQQNNNKETAHAAA